MWPLEIKVFLTKEGDKKETKIFPAIIKIKSEENKTEEKEEETQEEMKFIQETKKETRREIIKCEIALSRNGEGHEWNLQS